MGEVDLGAPARHEARWRLLRALDAGRPHSVSELLLWRVLDDIGVGYSPHQVRRELDYLAGLGMIAIVDREVEHWQAQLTAAGVDYVEYASPDAPGIARPRKWWG